MIKGLNISFLACTKVELICIAVNGEKSFKRDDIYSVCILLSDKLVHAKYQKHTHTETNTHTDTHTDAHKDSNEYSIVAFCKNTTMTRKRFSEKPIVVFTNSTVFVLDFNVYY